MAPRGARSAASLVPLLLTFSLIGSIDIVSVRAGDCPNDLLPVESLPHTKPLPPVEWSPDRPFAQEISAGLVPVLLRNTVVAQWPALAKWTPEYLAAAFPTLQGVKRQRGDNVFYYSDKKKPLTKLGFAPPASIERVPQMRTAEFFAAQRAGAKERREDDEWLYYSGYIPEEARSILSDLQPHLSWLHVTGRVEAYSIWLGGRNTTAHCHTDAYHNFYAQLYGRKRWLLFPPSDSEDLYMYSQLHPLARRSQVDFAAPDVAKFPAFANLVAYDVTLEPGDLLYIPPYWFHHVIAPEISISVNVWTELPFAVFTDPIRPSAPPLPRLASATAFTAPRLLKAALARLIPEVLNQSPSEAARGLLERRWQGVLGSKPELIRQELLKELRMICDMEALPLEPLHDAFVSRLIELFNEIEPFGVRRLLLLDYVEEIVAGVMSVDLAAGFLAACM